MAQKILIVLTALAALVLNIAQANSAQLSTNPWLEANDDEAVAEVYRKEQRRQNLRSLNYQAEGTATIDRTHAYIQDAGENGATEEDEGQALVPNTAANRQALAQQRQAAQVQQEDSGFAVPTFDFSGQINRLQRSLQLPKLPSMTGMIQKFERASGVDFKKMGKTILFVSHDLGSISKYCDRVVLLNRGKKLAEGTPKEMVSMYKRIMVNQDKAEEIAAHQMDMSSLEEDDEKEIKEAACEGQWKNHYNLNPDVDEYGNGAAEIEDFAIIDENGNYTNAIVKGTRFRLKSKVKFKQDVHDPIFTYTFKNIQGVAITGTNTMYEKKDVPLAKEGETYVATFEQDMFLQGGEYLLSMSCTGYRDGEFQVYHRLYDVCNVTVVSDKNTVGFYDMNSVTTVEKIEE